jgi:hypothetical protein
MRIWRTMDSTDLRLLTEIQRRADITAQELGEILNLSASQVARRPSPVKAASCGRDYRLPRAA